MTDNLLDELNDDELMDGLRELLHDLDGEVRAFNQLAANISNMPKLLISGAHVVAYTRTMKDWLGEMEHRGWNPSKEWPHKKQAEMISAWVLAEAHRGSDERFLRSMGISGDHESE